MFYENVYAYYKVRKFVILEINASKLFMYVYDFLKVIMWLIYSHFNYMCIEFAISKCSPLRYIMSIKKIIRGLIIACSRRSYD